MARFHVKNSFVLNGQLVKEGAPLFVGDEIVRSEVAKGMHPKKPGVHLSGLVTHCSPADARTAALIAGKPVPAAADDEGDAEDEEQPRQPQVIGDVELDTDTGKAQVISSPGAEQTVESIQSEMDEMGIGYDKRWNLDRLKKELIKAKKIRGV